MKDSPVVTAGLTVLIFLRLRSDLCSATEADR